MRGRGVLKADTAEGCGCRFHSPWLLARPVEIDATASQRLLGAFFRLAGNQVALRPKTLLYGLLRAAGRQVVGLLEACNFYGVRADAG